MKNNEWRRIISFSLPYLKGYWSKFTGIFSLIVLGAVIASIEPIIWGKIIDCLTVVRFHDLIQLLLLYLGITLLTFALGLLESYLGARLDYEIVNILVREYRCSGGTDTANPATGNRCSGTGIPHLIECHL